MIRARDGRVIALFSLFQVNLRVCTVGESDGGNIFFARNNVKGKHESHKRKEVRRK